MTDLISQFSDTLIDWYKDNARDLPWRNTTNAYHIWLSEIILQQTRVQQGLPYYEKFIQLFPTIDSLANASEDKVLKTWEGLGYYSRARNLHYTAKYITYECNGIFPSSYEEIIQLKGIGPYTAAAIASFAFKEIKPAIDGNVYRVLSRIFDIEAAIDDNRSKKYFEQLSMNLISKRNPDTYNQAMMELGATICKPKGPHCLECIFQTNCLAFAKDIIALRPVKKKKIIKRNRYFNFFLLKHESFTWIEKRDYSDIWKGLYQFPLLEQENSKTSTNKQFHQLKELLKTDLKGEIYTQNQWFYKQDLTHQKLHIKFHVINLKEAVKLPKTFIRVSSQNLKDYAFSKTLKSFIDDYFSYL